MSQDIVELVERVKAATGPDREIDRVIWCRSFGRKRMPRDMLDAVPAYTASIDAALALTERVLPGYRGNLQFGSAWDAGVYQAGKLGCTIHSPMSSGGGPLWKGFAPTLPLAILAATLSALAQVKP